MTSAIADPARRAREALAAVLPAFLVAKAVTLAAMLASIANAGNPLSWQQLRAAFDHWDTVAYVDIAAHGYPSQLDYRDVHLPGLPLLIRAASFITGDLVAAGVLVSAVAELVALVAVLVLVRRERDDATARFAVWAVALLPLAFFLTAVYTESAFIAGAALSLMLMRAGRFRGAAIAGAFAAAVRLTGLVLIPVMLVELVRQGRLRRDGAWTAVVVLPLVVYGAYMQVRVGDPLAAVHAQALPSYGITATWPWDGLRVTLATVTSTTDPVNRDIFIREIIAGLVGMVVVVAAWVDRGFPRSFALYCSLVWLLAVSLTFWRSVARYDLALFPAVIVVADLTARAPRLRLSILAASAAVLAWGAWVFAEGGWIG